MSEFKGAVVYADDTSSNRFLIERWFKSVFPRLLETRMAEDGQEALALLRQVVKTYPHRTILMSDVQMPIMDGLELIRRVREDKNPIIARVPLVMHSSKSLGEVGEAIRAALSGKDDFEFLEKPSELAVFEAILSRVLARLNIPTGVNSLQK